MRTYYKVLDIAPDATTTEIETAYEVQYNHWRRLVTHHDPEMSNRANQALQWLEKVRTTLTDPGKRQAYDTSIGLSHSVGGLADPKASLPPSSMRTLAPPPPPRPSAPVPSSHVDAWVCSKCGAASATGSVYCKSCGNLIGQQCPTCEAIFENTASFCPACGTNPGELRQEQIRAQEEAELKIQRTIQVELEKAKSHLQARRYRLAKETVSICGQERPEWRAAQAIVKSADVVKKELVMQMLPYSAGGYAFVGLIAGLITGGSYDGLTFGVIGLIVGAILGAVGPVIYYGQWGGKSSLGQDQVLAALVPLGIALGLALAAAAIYIVVIVIIVIVVLFIAAIALGGG